MKQLTIVFDCNYIAQRARTALNGVVLTNGDFRTEVIFQFCRTVLYVCKQFNPTEWIFCWDAKRSYRLKEYPDYKITRRSKKRTEEEKELNKTVNEQIKELQLYFLKKLGFVNIFKQNGLESDDLMAIIVMSHPDKEFLVHTTDKDMFQILAPNVKIYNPALSKKLNPVVTDEFLRNEYGITPEQWGLGKAIGGCNTDDVTGISGVGDPAKSKSNGIVFRYLRGTLKKGIVYDRIKSEEGQRIIERNKPLVVLPHKETKLPEVKRTGTLYKRRFIQTFEEYGFTSFTRPAELRQWTSTFNLYGA